MLNTNSYNVDILVNGNKCKQYNHESKFFIEAKEGSEYEIKIDNNGYKNILAIVSVDGLDVLTGKPASGDSSGYIINSFSSYRIKGFRYSSDTVGAFKFVKKNESYAASKGQKSKKNCGVIGVRIYEEKQPVVTTDGFPYYQYYNLNYDNLNFNDNNIESQLFCKSSPMTSTTANIYTTTLSGAQTYNMSTNVSSYDVKSICNNPPQTDNVIKPRGFDMGSDWGTSKESRVVDATFERGNLVSSIDIYYASRESLIEMGVPLRQEGKVNLPKSFPGGFANPPVNWKP